MYCLAGDYCWTNAFVSSKIPSQLDPAGLFKSDGKHPDGLTIIPWSCGQFPVCDVTCPDTLAIPYQDQTTTAAGKATAAAEDRKTNKYSNFDQAYLFMPVAINTFGPFGPKSLAFVKVLESRIWEQTGEELATSYVMQRLSMAI